jgi:uncharacterized protein YqeY
MQLEQLINDAIAATHAQDVKDKGQVMGQLKPQVQGRADMREVSKKVKQLLS